MKTTSNDIYVGWDCSKATHAIERASKHVSKQMIATPKGRQRRKQHPTTSMCVGIVVKQRMQSSEQASKHASKEMSATPEGRQRRKQHLTTFMWAGIVQFIITVSEKKSE